LSQLIVPHGGELQDKFLSENELKTWKTQLETMPSWYLNERQFCDTKLILSGGFSPLTGFLSKADYHAVLNDMQLTNGLLWPIPINLDVSHDFAAQIEPNTPISLRNEEGLLIAIMEVTDIWVPDKQIEAKQIYGTTDETHPGVFHLQHYTDSVYLGGKLLGVQLPKPPDFIELRNTPRELRDYFAAINCTKIIGYQTRKPMHRAHFELTLQAAQHENALLLLHPCVGVTSPDDIDHYTRVKCYKEILKYYPENIILLSLLPLAMRMAGPKEALWHAIIRKNYGCSHFIVGHNHAGPDYDKYEQHFYKPYEAQALVSAYQEALAIKMIPYQELVYSKEKKHYMSSHEITSGDEALKMTHAEFKQRLQLGMDIPSWFSFPEVVQILRKRFPPKREQGFTLFFTGLSGAGKSTIANLLKVKLMENTGRPVTLLDGDLVRLNLSKGLGFSKEDRDTNIKRIGFVASEITKNHGIAICAPIAPYKDTRHYVRKLIELYGGFIEVYLSTSLETCENRDPKGLYQKARAGIIKDFTGIDDPYEAPDKPEIQIDTSKVNQLEAVNTIYKTLVNMGYVEPEMQLQQITQAKKVES